MGLRDKCVKGLTGLVLGASLVCGSPTGNVDRAYADDLNRVFAAQAGWDLLGGLMRDGASEYDRKVAEQRERKRAALEQGQGTERVVYMPVVVEREPEKRLVIREWYDHDGDGHGQRNEYGKKVDGIADNGKYGLSFDLEGEDGDVEFIVNDLSRNTSKTYSGNKVVLNFPKEDLEHGKYQFSAKDSRGNTFERKLYIE
jgi:hypothetical protein